MESQFLALYRKLLQTLPSRADAAVWLQGDRYDRGPKTLELFRKRLVKMVVLAGNNIFTGGGNRVDENNISLKEMRQWLLKRGVDRRRIIMEDTSYNTKDQAVRVIALAVKKRWRTIILVASPYHQPRAFLTFLRQKRDQNWTGIIYNQPAMISLGEIPSGRQQASSYYLKVEARKIAQYGDDVASIKQGLDYLASLDRKITFRPASLRDRALLLRWRNDPEARQNFFNTSFVSSQEHIDWLREVLKDSRRQLFIILNERRLPIGQVRFDIVRKHAEISITLDKKYRHGGYGTIAIRQASEKFLRQNSQVKKILAKIKLGNDASAMAFSRAGYRHMKQQDGYYILEFILKN